MSNAFVSLYLVSVPRVQSISLARAFSHATRTASFAQPWNSASDIDTSRRKKEERGKRMTQTELASFRGSSTWAKRKRAWYTLFSHAQFPLDFWEFENFCKISSVTPTSTRYADFSLIKGACHWPRSVWTMTKEWRLQKLSHVFMDTSGTLQHVTQSFSLKFTNHFKRSNADCHRESDVLNLKITRMSLWLCVYTKKTMFHQL